MATESEILQNLEKAVIEGNEELANKSAEQVFDAGVDPMRGVEALSKGMKFVGGKYPKEMFLPDLLLAADAMNAGLKVLTPHVKVERLKAPGKFVLGTVQGDIHDIGKKFVIAMLKAAGFEVYDLGTDVPAKKFVEEAVKVNADFIGSSAFMTTTISFQKDLENALRKAGVRDRFITMVGGSATNPRWARDIGADGWAKDALETVEKARLMLKEKSKITQAVI